MASATVARSALRAPSKGYRRLFVPLLDAELAADVVDVACRLAAVRQSTIATAVVLEVPPVLPLDARMDGEDRAARRLHRQAEVIADAYGVATVAQTVRARAAGPALLDLITDGDFEIVVLAGVRRARWNRRAVFSRAVQHVLRKAPCRVLVIAPPA